MPQDSSEHEAKVQDFFDRRVDAYDAFYEPHSAFERWFSRVFRKAVYLRRDQVPILAQRYGCKTMLDVGCGSGRNSVWFARNGIERVHGIDISQEMTKEAIALAEQAGVADKCDFQHLDFGSMPTGEKFDLVGALGVFDYVEQPAEFLAHMAEFTNRVVYGSFPGYTLVRSPLRKIRYSLRGCPIRFYRKRELEVLFGKLKFDHCEVLPVPSGYLAWAVRGSS
jgi:cyclopropane fatty-acyl-phospholipid synthase-like methyltransferase